MSRKFLCKTVPSTWLQSNGRRLDCGPYLSGAMEARELLRKLRCDKEPLQSLTDGIYHAGRESRLWVESPEHGVPFMGSTDILASDLSGLPLISRKQVDANPNFTIHAGWTLITRSGTIGRMAYARADMDGIACSEHVMRVVPNEAKAESGFIYAYLCSKFGLPIVLSGTYGSIIQSIEPHHLADLPVPRLGEVEHYAHELVQMAAHNRVRASQLIAAAISDVRTKLGLCAADTPAEMGPSISCQPSSLLMKRMDSFYYSDENIAARAAFDEVCANHGESQLGSVADVWIPGIFKRQYVDDQAFGCPYFTGKEIYELSPTTDLYLRLDIVQQNRLALKRGMILIQDSGQVSGLIGHPVMVGANLHGASCTNNMVRVIASSEADTGFIFALLSTDHGTRLLKREASGSSIPHLEEGRVKSLVIPWPQDSIRSDVGQKVLEAMNLRDEATVAENDARTLIERAIEEGGR